MPIKAAKLFYYYRFSNGHVLVKALVVYSAVPNNNAFQKMMHDTKLL